MSLKKTLFLIAFTIALLLPAAHLLKTQTPWTCFAFTFDESVFAQAAANWIDGKGYRISGDALPFEPKITVGLPMAWGAQLFQRVTGGDVAHSGRVFVYACFLLVLWILGRSAYRRDREWMAVPVAIGIFAFVLSKIPYGGYFAFGFLGEMPAFVFAALTYRALDERKFLRAGIYAVGAFALKPTFVFFPIAAVLASLLFAARAGIHAAITATLTTFWIFYGISDARGQPIFKYLEEFYSASNAIAQGTAIGVPSGDLIGFLMAQSDPVKGILGAIMVVGGVGAIRRRRRLASVPAAFLVLLFSALYYLGYGKMPVDKQWWAIVAVSALGFAIHWGAEFAHRFAGWTSRESMRALVLAVVATWVLSVGTLAYHQYKRIPETACASKEQSTINTRLRALADEGAVKPDSLGAWIEKTPYTMSLYRIGWNPTYYARWQDLGPTLPKWIYGESKNLFPSPTGCRPEFRGETFSLLRCEVVPPKAPRKAPPQPSHKAPSRPKPT